MRAEMFHRSFLIQALCLGFALASASASQAAPLFEKLDLFEAGKDGYAL